MLSLPAPPKSRSRPPPPRSLSAPPRPTRTSALRPPANRSPRGPPRSVRAWTATAATRASASAATTIRLPITRGTLLPRRHVGGAHLRGLAERGLRRRRPVVEAHPVQVSAAHQPHEVVVVGAGRTVVGVARAGHGDDVLGP